MQEESDTKILVINCGSSSLKYEVWQMPHRVSLGRGMVERIGELKGKISQKTPKEEYVHETQVPHHKAAMELVREALTDKARGVLARMEDIAGVGHRVVHGGEQYANSVIIDDAVIAAVEKNAELAPLHNPPNLIGIREAMSLLPKVKHVAVFDTAFHQTMPPAAYLYGLPYELYEKYKNPPVRIPRHEPPLRGIPRPGAASPFPGEHEHHHVPPRQRRLGHGNRARQVRGYLNRDLLVIHARRQIGTHAVASVALAQIHSGIVINIRLGNSNPANARNLSQIRQSDEPVVMQAVHLPLLILVLPG